MSDTAPEPIEVTAPDGSTVTILGRTADEQARLKAEQEAEWVNQRRLAGFIADFQNAIGALTVNNWDFLDAYSDRQFVGQNQTPGADWPQMPADPDPTSLAQAIVWVNRKIGVVNQRIEILRTQLSFVSFAQTREAQAFELIVSVLRKAIIRDPSLAPPSVVLPGPPVIPDLVP